MDTRGPGPHLTDAELFGLAAPASGEPQPLPEHLSRCESCARALQEWRGAMRELGREDVAVIDDRPEEEWASAREATMSAVRRARPRRTAAAVRWAAGAAAVVLLVAFAMPARRRRRYRPRPRRRPAWPSRRRRTARTTSSCATRSSSRRAATTTPTWRSRRACETPAVLRASCSWRPRHWWPRASPRGSGGSARGSPRSWRCPPSRRQAREDLRRRQAEAHRPARRLREEAVRL